MTALLEFAAGLMWSHLWQGLLLTALVALVMRWRSKDSAAARHSAWLVTLMVMLLMPLLVFLPEKPVDLPSASPQSPTTAVTASTARMPMLPPASPAARLDRAPAATIAQPAWPLLAAGLWLVILAWQVGQLRRARHHVAGLRGAAEPVSDSVQNLSDRLVRRVGLSAPVPVFWSDTISSPQTNGTWSPAVLLPASWKRGVDRGLLEHTLVHELGHIKRKDHWVVWLQFTARILYGFNPAVWYAIHQINRERESACDDWAVGLGAAPSAYANSLVSVAESLLPTHSGKRDPELAIPCLRSRNHLRRRIAHMLDLKKDHSTRPLGRIVILAAVLTVTGTAIASPNWPTLTRVKAAIGHATAASWLAGVADRSPRPGDGLLYAAWTGDLAEAERLIAEGADVDEKRSRDPRTPLVAAARNGHWAVVRLLLDNGADVNYHAMGDETALMAAANSGSEDIVIELLQRGARANEKVRGDGSPLIAAARSGSREAVQRLLDAGADPNLYVRGDEAPLFHAVVGGHADVVEALIRAGADPSVEYRGDGTPLMLAIRHGHDDIAELLLKAGAAVNSQVRGDGTALIDAARRNDLVMIEALIAAGADVNLSVSGDGNALINASRAGHMDVALLLVDAGADVNGRVQGDDTPLINAVWSGNPELVRMLLDQGADPNLQGDYDSRLDGYRTPLNQAGDQQEIAGLLLRAGAR